MIKTWIHYKIINQCIDVLFDQLYDNFIKPIISNAQQVNVKWTLESANEIRAFYALNIGDEVTNMLKREIERELYIESLNKNKRFK